MFDFFFRENWHHYQTMIQIPWAHHHWAFEINCCRIWMIFWHQIAFCVVKVSSGNQELFFIFDRESTTLRNVFRLIDAPFTTEDDLDVNWDWFFKTFYDCKEFPNLVKWLLTTWLSITPTSLHPLIAVSKTWFKCSRWNRWVSDMYTIW